VPDEDPALAEMISTLGPLPDRWWRKWSARGEFFLEDGTWKQDTTRCHAAYSRPLSERLRIMGRGAGGEEGEKGFSSKELAALEAFLGSLSTYERSERIAAAAAQDEAWMVEYGLPAVKRNHAGRH
jgi:serine/threonine-protein kinase SRPK3